jgi:peptidyl-prolyl cis-trans isomerase SurA
MKTSSSALTLACLVLLGTASTASMAQAQGLRLGGAPAGITDIMGGGAARPGPAPSMSAPSAPAGGQRAAGYIVALVNSEPITNTEVQTRVDRVLSENAEARRAPLAEVSRLVLERLISERAQLQLAKESGIRIDDVTVDQAEETVARQNQINVAELRRRVISEGISPAEFRTDLRNQLLLTRLREREVNARVKIGDAEVDQFIQEQRSGNVASSEINLAQVLVAVPDNASESQIAALEQKAQALAGARAHGEDFAVLARDNSDSPDRVGGGALGLRSVQRYPQPFVDATQALPVGGVAGPIRSGAGFHVLKVLAKGKADAVDGTVAQTRVRHILLRTDAQRSTAQAIAQLTDFKRRLQGGTADFAGLARDNSQDGSAKDGGDLGWMRAGQFVPEFEEVVQRLAPGQVSDPVVSRFGVHLIEVVGRREGKLSQAEQREAARAVLREKRMDEAFDTWAQEVRAKAYVEFRQPPV